MRDTIQTVRRLGLTLLEVLLPALFLLLCFIVPSAIDSDDMNRLIDDLQSVHFFIIILS